MCFLSSSEPPHTSLRSILGNHLRYCTEIDFQVIRQERGGYEERLIREMKKKILGLLLIFVSPLIPEL